MHFLIGLIALSGFILSLAAHLSALFGIDVAAHVPYVWGLHVGMFVVFVPFIFSIRKTLGPKPTFAEIRANFPNWVVVTGSILLAYVVINFALFMLSTSGGDPSMQNGKFILASHGHLIREITFTEYTALKANQIRGFSGHWLVFYYLPMAYFLFSKKRNPASLAGTYL